LQGFGQPRVAVGVDVLVDIFGVDMTAVFQDDFPLVLRAGKITEAGQEVVRFQRRQDEFGAGIIPDDKLLYQPFRNDRINVPVAYPGLLMITSGSA